MNGKCCVHNQYTTQWNHVQKVIRTLGHITAAPAAERAAYPGDGTKAPQHSQDSRDYQRWRQLSTVLPGSLRTSGAIAASLTNTLVQEDDA